MLTLSDLPTKLVELGYNCSIIPCNCKDAEQDNVFSEKMRVFFRAEERGVGTAWKCLKCGTLRVLPMQSEIELMGLTYETETLECLDSDGSTTNAGDDELYA